MGRHDRLFKPLLQAFFGDLLHLVVPEMAPYLDPAGAEFLDKETFTDLPGGRRREMDLVARVPAGPVPAGPVPPEKSRKGRKPRASSPEPEERIVLVAVEIEGRYRSAFARRLWKYVMYLYSRHELPVLPIVVFLEGGPAGVELRSYREEVLGFEMVRSNFYALGLSRARAEEWLVKPEPLASALAALMRRKTLTPAEQKLACLKGIVRVEVDEARRFLLFNTVETYLQLEEDEMEQYAAMLEREPDPEVQAMEMTWADKIEARGREAGFLAGTRELIFQLLEERFGEVPPYIRKQLAEIEDAERLQALATRLFKAGSLDELDLLSGS